MNGQKSGEVQEMIFDKDFTHLRVTKKLKNQNGFMND